MTSKPAKLNCAINSRLSLLSSFVLVVTHNPSLNTRLIQLKQGDFVRGVDVVLLLCGLFCIDSDSLLIAQIRETSGPEEEEPIYPTSRHVHGQSRLPTIDPHRFFSAHVHPLCNNLHSILLLPPILISFHNCYISNM